MLTPLQGCRHNAIILTNCILSGVITNVFSYYIVSGVIMNVFTYHILSSVIANVFSYYILSGVIMNLFTTICGWCGTMCVYLPLR